MALRDDVAARLKKLLAVTDDLEVVAEATIPLVREAERERCAQRADAHAEVLLEAWKAMPNNQAWALYREAQILAAAIRALKDE